MIVALSVSFIAFDVGVRKDAKKDAKKGARRGARRDSGKGWYRARPT